ncbi:MarR family winged helix-turn-helix transcriptional regulator [Thermomonospora echinospora]|nr:MarR family transcriptional regulator [Thermomonospora echinospora]
MDEAPADIAEIERALDRVSHLLTRARRHGRTVAEAGVPVDRAAVPVLRLLADAPGPLRPGELAVRLAVEAPHVTRQLQRLEKAGMVERVPDPRDGRAHRVRLTDAGRAAVDRIRAVSRRWMAEALADWPVPERRLFAALLHRMVDDFLAHAAEHGTLGAEPRRPCCDDGLTG